MKNRRRTVVTVTAGLAVAATAPLLSYVVAPHLTKLPDNSTVSIDYKGTATMINPAAIESGDANDLLVSGVPIIIRRKANIKAHDGDTAVIHDHVVTSAAGQESTADHRYAVDRRSLVMVDGPDGEIVEPSTGCLAFAFPVSPDVSADYRFYDPGTQQCFVAEHTGDRRLNGRDVLQYEVKASGPLVDPVALAGLPAAVPKATLAGMATAMPADVAAQMGPALAALPDPVPLSYASETTVELDVDSRTGAPINQTIHQVVTLALALGGREVPVAPAIDLTAEMSDDSQKELADQVATGGMILNLLTRIGPGALLASGALIAGFGIFAGRRRRAAEETLDARNEQLISARR